MINIVNIKNFKSGAIPKNISRSIHAKQAKLMEKYKEIEKMPDWPININLSAHQSIIKDFKQRISEEMAEGYEAYLNHDKEHFYEELIDGLHFATELNLLVGRNSKSFESFDRIHPLKDTMEKNMWMVVYKYGLLMNMLKNKPWKQSQVRTDEKRFFALLKECYETYIALLKTCGMTPQDIYIYYYKKNKVNQFRQRSKY